ncbi:dsDNA nuclease domain-containing protein [Archangium lansingense]|uniref:DsDNA nuclease domain-containing protein n=1 Tax=Archangium lansingense TaxID=2995310 RepID=A0ABT4AC30_9BACT|nr:dsDNA nuclease domain-containing protein [Archangium lansinium]MCY1079230.1 dsDNA nuclease domain-containing protein [Archangium lansinium]
MTPPKKLGEVLPREQIGAVTGGLYEYQYQQAAGACLTILEDAETHCVFCEWHDDYVVEKHTPNHVIYGFHQVKTRSASQGPWKMRQLFGLGKPKQSGKKGTPAKVPPAAPDSIIAKMMEHQSNFTTSCKHVVLGACRRIAEKRLLHTNHSGVFESHYPSCSG